MTQEALTAILGTPREGWALCKDGRMLAWIQQRPEYCDRGRYHSGVEAPHWRSEADPWPRYYFDLEAAKSETEAYCRAKKINIEGATWRLE